MNILKRKISYKTSVIVFAVILLLAATIVNLSLNAGQSRTKSDNSKTNQVGGKASNQEGNTSGNEDNNTTENTSDSTQTDTQTNPGNTSTTNPPTSQPPASQPPSTQPPPTPPPCGSTIIVINSSGNYSQLNVTTTQGSSICWVNNDNKSHWPASDPHPQHTNYSGFDSEGIAGGGSWSFTFNTKGFWGWHDHQFPSTSGTITVL